jgi:hypothetical protein
LNDNDQRNPGKTALRVARARAISEIGYRDLASLRNKRSKIVDWLLRLFGWYILD